MLVNERNPDFKRLDFDNEASLAEAVRRKPLPNLMEEHGDALPPRGACPFCKKKGKARLKRIGDQWWFKCYNPQCPSGTADKGRSWTEIPYLMFRLSMSRGDAFQAYLKMTNVWVEREKFKAPPKPAAKPASKPAAHEDARPTATLDAEADAFASNENNLADATSAPVAVEGHGATTGATSDAVADAAQSQQSEPPATELTPSPADVNRPGEVDDEEVIQKCIQVVRTENKGSISLLQRRLSLGYSRAARIMDELERRGIVGPARGAEPREVLPSKDGPAAVPPADAPAAPPQVEGKPPTPDGEEKVIPFPGKTAEKPEPEEELPPGLKVLREFYEQLPPTQMEMRPYLEDGSPVPAPIPKEVAAKLKFRPVPIFERRGLETATCQAMGLRANPGRNKKILEDLCEKRGWDEMFAAGLALPADRRRKLPDRLNTQFCGKGQVGKKPDSERRDKDDKWVWGWCEPVLIPYFDEHGRLVRLRPHKGGPPEGTVGGTRLYVPRRAGEKAQEKFDTVVICEGEYKAMALWQMVGGGSALPEKKRVGVCAIPGISYGKNVEMREELQAWLWSTFCSRVIIAFDDEDKSHEPRWKRFDALKWARYLATSIHLKMGKTALVCVLPKEWRDAKGKADWDGALVKLLQGNIEH